MRPNTSKYNYTFIAKSLTHRGRVEREAANQSTHWGRVEREAANQSTTFALESQNKTDSALSAEW